MPPQPNDWETVDDWEDVPIEDTPKSTTKSNWMKDTWDWANKPMFDQPSKAGHTAAESFDDPSTRSENPWAARIRGFGAGAMEGAGDVISGLTSPLNVATTAATMGAGTAAKYGMGTAAKGLALTGRALSAPVAAHGAVNVLHPESTMGERGFGLAELAGGIAGTQYHAPVPTTSGVKPGLQKVGQQIKEPALPMLVAEGKVVKTGNEMPVGKGTPESVISAAIESAPDKPSVVTIKGQSPEAVKQLKAEGYKPAGISSEGYPIMKKEAITPPMDETITQPDAIDPDTAALNELTNKLEGETQGMEMINDEGDVQSTTQNNGSGESAASQEAMNRDFSMKGKEEQFVVYDKSGKARPLIGPEAVDYVAKPGETYGVESPEGFKVLTDNGGKPPSVVSEGTANELPAAWKGLTEEPPPPKTKLQQLEESKEYYKKELIKARVAAAAEEGSVGPAHQHLANLESKAKGNGFKLAAERKKGPSQKELNEEALLKRRQAAGNAPPDKPPKPPLDFESPNENAPVTADEIRKTVPVEKIPEKINKINDQVKAAKMAPPEVRPGIVQQLEDAQREILTGLDVSFIGRQGKGLITHKGYWTAFDDMFKAFGSKKAAQLVNDSITEHKSGLFKDTIDAEGKIVKPYAERAGLKLADFWGGTEETMRSSIVEKGKYNPFAAAARSNKAFINKARSDVFADLIGELKRRGIDPETDLVLGKQIANSVNVSSGKGNMGKLSHPTLNLDTGTVERSAAMGLLNKIFFAPEFVASRVQTFNRVLNPITGALNPLNKMDPTLRKEAIRSLLGIVGTGLLVQEMARQAGAIVLNDPTNPDFRKIKIGNSRIDNFAGLGQYGVGTAQFLMGQKTSSNSMKTTNLSGGFGSGNPKKYGAKSSFDLASDFAVNRAAPIPSLIISWMRGKDFDGKPFEWKKAIATRTAPLVLQDMYDIAADDPSLIPLGILPVIGEGIQTYGR